MALKELLTVKELQETLKVSRTAITNWRAIGMPYKKIGKSVRFDGDEVAEWIRQQDKKNG